MNNTTTFAIKYGEKKKATAPTIPESGKRFEIPNCHCFDGFSEEESVTHFKECYESRIAALQAEVGRLKAGKWTKEEIHNLCHTLPKIVSACEFAKGCEEYQKKLYGHSPTELENQRLREAIGELIEAGDLFHFRPNMEQTIDNVKRKWFQVCQSARAAALAVGGGK